MRHQLDSFRLSVIAWTAAIAWTAWVVFADPGPDARILTLTIVGLAISAVIIDANRLRGDRVEKIADIAFWAGTCHRGGPPGSRLGP